MKRERERERNSSLTLRSIHTYLLYREIKRGIKKKEEISGVKETEGEGVIGGVTRGDMKNSGRRK